MKRIAKLLSLVIMSCILLYSRNIVVSADANSVPAVIRGYVGDCNDLESKYDIYIDEIEDEDIYYDGDFIHAGSTTITYYDDDGNEGISEIKVSYSPKLRLIADEWRYTGTYYYLRVINITNKSVTFTNSTAYYKYKGKSYKFKLTSKSVTIKPGKSKTLKFKRNSKKFKYMPSTNKAYMKMKCKLSGKTYTLKNVHGSVNFYQYSNKKWIFIDYKGDYDLF